MSPSTLSPLFSLASPHGRENSLMADTPLEELGYGKDGSRVAFVEPVDEDRKEGKGFTAGKHIKERKKGGWIWGG